MGILETAVSNLKAFTPPAGGGRSAPFFNWATAGIIGGGTSLPDERDYANLVGDGSGSVLLNAAIGWIATQFSEARMVITEDGAGGIRTIVPGHPAARLLRRPTWDPKLRRSWYSGSALLAAMVTSYWFDANAYALKERDPLQRVVRIWYCPHWMIEPVGGGMFIDHYAYRPKGARGETIKLPPSEVWHVRAGIDPENPLKGWNRVKSLMRELYTDEQAARFTASMLKNRGMPGVILAPAKDSKMAIKKEDRDALKTQYQQEFSGDNVGGIMVFGQPTELKEFGFSPEQLKLGDLRDIPEERVAALTLVPANVLGFGTGMQGTKLAGTLREGREQAWENNLIPTQNTFAQEFDGQVLPDFEPDARLEHLESGWDLRDVGALQDLQLRKAEVAARWLSSGLAWKNEARAKVGLPPVDGGDSFAPQPGVQGDQTPPPPVD